MRQVDEVKNIMVENIEQVIDRGEKIADLETKTDDLRNHVAAVTSSSLDIHEQHFLGC